MPLLVCWARPAPGYWLKYWQRKLSLRAVLTGRPKGRSVKALRERCTSLIADPESRATGLLLQEFLERVELARRWRGGQAVVGLSYAKLEEGLGVFELEKVIVPADIAGALVQRAAERLRTQRNWLEWARIMMPFSDQESNALVTFKPREPRLRDLPKVAAFRCSAFTHALVEKNLIPMLLEGEPGSKCLLEFCVAVRACLEEQEIFVMDTTSAAVHTEVTLGICGLIAVIELPFNSSCSEGVKSLSTRHSRGSVLDMLAQAVAQVPWWRERLKQLQEALPVIHEKADKIEEQSSSAV